MKNEYGLYRRKGKKVWYFWYYQGHKRITKSTGKTLKHEAKKYVEDFLKVSDKSRVTFKDFTKDFFTDSCRWVKKQRAYNRSMSDRMLEQKRRILKKHLIPTFGDLFLHEIKKKHIEDYLINLERAGQTKNHILFTLRQILRQAEDEGIIELSPAERVQSFSVHHKPKGVFTIDELKKLFPDDEQELLRIWWDMKHVALFLILGCTGIRSGEIRALMWQDYLKDEMALFIQHAIKDDRATIIGETKTGDKRIVLLSEKACRYLDKWNDLSLYALQEDIIFYSEKRDKAFNRWSLTDSLYKAFKKTGIQKRDRTVHSFRHTFNTIFRNMMPDDLLRLLTGHKTERMTAHYDKPGIPDMLKRIEAARGMIDKMF
jgi:integrase